MRLLLCCLALTACDAPTAPVVRKSANLTMAWDSTLAEPTRRPRPQYIPCDTRPDTVALWIDGVRYLEIVEHCE